MRRAKWRVGHALLTAFVLSCAMTLRVAGAEPVLRVLPLADADDFPEPPALSVMGARDDSGKTWRETGRLRGSFPVASEELRSCLIRQGWKVTKIVASGRTGQKNEVSVWQKKGLNIMVMVWEVDLAECCFAWGRETTAGDK